MEIPPKRLLEHFCNFVLLHSHIYPYFVISANKIITRNLYDLNVNSLCPHSFLGTCFPGVYRRSLGFCVCLPEPLPGFRCQDFLAPAEPFLWKKGGREAGKRRTCQVAYEGGRKRTAARGWRLRTWGPSAIAAVTFLWSWLANHDWKVVLEY